jgi:hypothetical protein
MTAILTSANTSLTVPAPRYKMGERLHWTEEVGSKRPRLSGIVVEQVFRITQRDATWAYTLGYVTANPINGKNWISDDIVCDIPQDCLTRNATEATKVFTCNHISYL